VVATLVETIGLGLAASIAKSTAKVWLQLPVSGAAESMIDICSKRFDDFLTRRAATQMLEGIVDEVALGLSAAIEQEYSGLSDESRKSVIKTIEETLEEVDLSKQVLACDLEAFRLESALKPTLMARMRLEDDASRAFAEFLLRESCEYVITIVPKLPNYVAAATKEQLKRSSIILSEIRDALSQLGTHREQQGEDTHFVLRYQRLVAQKLNRVELFGVKITGSGTREYDLSSAYVPLVATVLGSDAPVPVVSVLSGSLRTLIQGEAGSGKTTLLQWIAVKAAQRGLPAALEDWRDAVPFYIRLRPRFRSHGAGRRLRFG